MEGSFFNDMRAAGACDLSAPIRRFCYQHGISPPAVPHAAAPEDYSTADMAGVSFQDLWLRAGGGTGYVYYHQARRAPEPLLNSPCCKQECVSPRKRSITPRRFTSVFAQLLKARLGLL